MKLPTGAYTVTQRIRFAHSDPAGIVFYPEFFRMFNDLFEDWMIHALGIEFADEFMVHQRMFPLVHVEVDFKESRSIGQTLDLTLILTGIGRSSIRYTIIGHDGDVECLRGALVTCVTSRASGKSQEIPDYIRKPMADYLKLCGAWTP